MKKLLMMFFVAVALNANATDKKFNLKNRLSFLVNRLRSINTVYEEHRKEILGEVDSYLEQKYSNLRQDAYESPEKFENYLRDVCANADQYLGDIEQASKNTYSDIDKKCLKIENKINDCRKDIMNRE